MAATEPPRRPPPRNPLHYRSPVPAYPRLTYAVQALLGFLAFLLCVGLGFLLAFLADEVIDNRQLELVGIVAPVAVAIAVLVCVSYYARVRLGWRGFLTGVLIAAGIILPIGGWFAAVLYSWSR